MMKGSEEVRADIWDKVGGKAKYSGDFFLTDMLYMKVLWPEYSPARILKIDTSKAETMPGVHRIILRKDITGTNLTGIFEPYDRPVLVGEGEEVRFRCDAVALAIADTEEQAARAAAEIKVEYEKLPGIYSIEEALKKEEAFLDYKIDRGDLEVGFREAELILEREYDVPYIEHAYIEPEAGYAYVGQQGIIHVCYGTQNIVRHQKTISRALDIPLHKLHLSSPYVGGAFGGKHALTVQVYLALAAKLLSRTVKITWTREESFQAAKRQPLRAKAKMGFRKDGTLTAYSMELFSPGGPYMEYMDKTLKGAVNGCIGPYDVQNLHIRARAYHTNNANITAFRGFGWPEGTLFIETTMDQAARKLGLDPREIRLRNKMSEEKWKKHVPGIQAELQCKMTMMDTYDKALQEAGPIPVVLGRLVGRGIATAACPYDMGNVTGYRGVGVDMELFSDGTINVMIGFAEIGQGITGVIGTLVSDFFQISGGRITVNYCDSHLSPTSGSLGGSRTTVNMGNAALDACKKLKARLEQFAEEALGESGPFQLTENGIADGSGLRMTMDDFFAYCYSQGKDMRVSGWYEGPIPGQARGFTFVTAVVDVAVDEETGDMEILQLVQCHDAGKVIYRDGARGQMIGGGLMALGTIHMEEFQFDRGRPKTPSLAEYLIPTAMDTPGRNEIVFIEEPASFGPHGAKGMGEHPMYAAPPAFVNAVADATGVLVTEYPLTAERLLHEMGRI